MEPFSASELERRAERSRTAAAEAGLDGLLVTPGPELTYLAGEVPVAASERLVLLSLPVDGEATLLVPELERRATRAAVGGAIEVRGWPDGDDPYAAAASALEAAGRYAVSDPAWALHLLGLQGALPDAAFHSMTSVLPMLRAVKSAEEIARLAEAGAGADRVFAEVLGLRFAGRREEQVAADLDRLLRENGHERVDFTIVGSGPNGADPHHFPGARVIEDGDMVVMDFGGLADGYGSDTTRTVHVGEPTETEREVYELVKAAQQAGFDAVQPGAACQEVDRAARAVIDAGGYGEHFLHRVGHGIGLTTHEPPYMVEGETREITPGLCFSIEPGIYLPDRFGVRIEDIVVATEDGARRLNVSEHELQIVH